MRLAGVISMRMLRIHITWEMLILEHHGPKLDSVNYKGSGINKEQKIAHQYSSNVTIN